MALSTYAELQASVASWLNRSDLTATIPDFIRMCEVQIGRRLIIDGTPREMVEIATITVNSEFINLPADFEAERALYLDDQKEPIRFVEPEKIVERKQLFPSQDGNPVVYSIVGTQLQFWPWTGTGTFTAELTYYQSIPALSNSNTTNWLLIKHPDAYLYGALMQSAPFLKNDARLAVWGELYTTIVADIIAAAKVAKTSTHMAMPVRVGGTP